MKNRFLIFIILIASFSINSCNKYIYALYSGNHQVGSKDASEFSSSNKIHVFDWNGNLLLDKRVNKICVDDEYIYGYDDEFGDILVAKIYSEGVRYR